MLHSVNRFIRIKSNEYNKDIIQILSHGYKKFGTLDVEKITWDFINSTKYEKLIIRASVEYLLLQSLVMM